MNEPGTLTISLKAADSDEWITVLSQNVPAGESAGSWDGMIGGSPIAPGEYAVQFSLTDETGFTGTAQRLSLTVTAAALSVTSAPTPEPVQETMIPSAHAPMEGENNYWTLPIGDFDEAAIWEVMMQPIVVIDSSKVKGKTQKDVYQLRKTPDNDASKNNIVGEITYDSQGLHILETRDDGWTLVEAYNSSYGPDCASRRGYGVTDDLIQGYVKTSLLKTITPRTDYGLLIDKVEQRMYIFSDGKCIGSLLVSTGLNNAKPGVKTIIENNYEHLMIDIDLDLVNKVIQRECLIAAAFTSQGTIHCKYEYWHGELFLTFEDTGTGFDSNIESTISERLERNPKLVDYGTGLDLPIIQAMVHKLGGRIEIQSEKNKGTTARITIPCKASLIEKKREEQ